MHKSIIFILIVALAAIIVYSYSFCEGVINGETASKDEFPSTVSILRSSDPENHLFEPHCSGIIITASFILTAAHCVENIDNSSLKIVAGDFHRFKSDSTEQMRRVTEIYPHPHWDIVSKRFDVALLRLHTPLIFGDSVRPASLPGLNTLDLDTKGNMSFAGWGRMSKLEEEYPDTLQKIHLRIVDKDTCEKQYKELTDGVEDFSGALCGLSVDGNSSLCSVDSGGGAFCRQGSQDVLCGILSFNIDCDPSPPAVFTLIDEPILKWINETVEKSRGLHNSPSDETSVEGNNESRTRKYFTFVVILEFVSVVLMVIVSLFYLYWKRTAVVSRIPDEEISVKENFI